MEHNFEEKLNAFKKIVLSDAGEQGELNVVKTERKANAGLEKDENDYLENAYETIQSKIQKIRQENNEKILHKDVAAKRDILRARENIVNKIFDEASEKLNAFRKTDDYITWLKNKIDKAVENLGDGKITLAFSNGDDAAKKIEEMYPSYEVVVGDDSRVIGGVKVFNNDNKTAIDCRFDVLIAEERTAFLQTGNLAISE